MKTNIVVVKGKTEEIKLNVRKYNNEIERTKYYFTLERQEKTCPKTVRLPEESRTSKCGQAQTLVELKGKQI